MFLLGRIKLRFRKWHRIGHAVLSFVILKLFAILQQPTPTSSLISARETYLQVEIVTLWKGILSFLCCCVFVCDVTKT
jgi:hypothetical protein